MVENWIDMFVFRWAVRRIHRNFYVRDRMTVFMSMWIDQHSDMFYEDNMSTIKAYLVDIIDAELKKKCRESVATFVPKD